MKTTLRFIVLFVFLPLIVFLASCSKTAENEHLPEYCQTYSGFMATASRDIYELVDGINRDEYLTAISVIELEFDSEAFDHEINLDGIQCFQNLTSLTLIGSGFKDISPISALKNIQKISLIDTSIVSIDSFKNLSKIKELTITGTKTLQSVDGVEEMIKLTRLELTNNGIVNIDGLNNLINLTELNLSENEISIFPSINLLTKLTVLDVSFNNIYELGDDLSGLSALESLNMSHNDIRDISSLDDLIKLETLDLGYNNLGNDGSLLSPDFSSLENSEFLNSIKLNDNGLHSIEGLRGLDLPLETLELQNNSLEDISPISTYTDLTKLVLYGNDIVSISDLSGMTGLKEIDLSENSIVDFSGLLSIPNLESINLRENSITSIPDLVTIDEEFWSHLIILDLSSNNLTDISGVEGHSNLQELLIGDNGLTTLSGLSDLPLLNTLEMTWEDPDIELYPTVDDWPEDFYSVTNHNLITRIDNSFNNLPSLSLVVILAEGESNERITHDFDFGFDTGVGLEIYGSINGLLDIVEIDFSDFEINHIDEFSIGLENLEVIDVSNTNIDDISFILNNPSLISLNIAYTQVTNLSVISGLNTSDLDNLDQIDASNISGANNLLDSFIDLPEISTILLNDSNIVSIENSFNSLSELTSFTLNSTELISIVDSFNDIFDFYTDENIIQLNESKLSIIEGSFNNGNYEFIEIHSNVSTGVTSISGSFNDITTSDLGYVSITGNDFRTIDSSFNDSEIDILILAFNFTEEITNSFVNLVTVGGINLSNNRLETLVGLNLASSIPELRINNNRLTTVSFIDGITDLSFLDISNQVDNDTALISLSTIEGINNMPVLETILMDGLEIDLIDGFKNIGIVDFYYSSTDNNGAMITSITSDSFSNNIITHLDLSDHDLDNIDFLTSFTSLVNLSISFDLLDISYFGTAVFENNLTSLAIENVQDTTDFSHLSGYDSLTFLSFDSLATLEINNLDGLNSLNSINFGNRDNITDFNNSFNNMPSLVLSESYLDLYLSLTSIDSSFDIYSPGDSVAIGGSIIVIDSFNNVGEVILNSDTETLFYIDVLSFDSMTTITIETSNHDSFVVLNSYLNLTDLTIETLNKNITDLSNSNIADLTIQSTDSSVDTFTLDIALSGSLIVSSSSLGTVDFNTVNATYEIYIPGSTVLTIDNSTANISGIYSDLTVNSSNIASVNLSNFTADISTFNANLLNQIIDSSFNTNGSTMTVNTLETTLDINVRVDSLYINDINANNYNIDTNLGDAYLNSDQPDLVVDFNGLDLHAEYNLLESIDLTGSVNEIILDSTNLDSATFNNSSIDTATITSNQAILSVTGTDVTNMDIINNSVNNLTANVAGANTTLSTSNSEVLNLTVDTALLEITGANIPSIIISTLSSIDNLDVINGTVLNTITLNDASVNNLSLTSSEATLNITGTDVTNVDLYMDNLNSITATTINGLYNINSSELLMDLNMIATSVFLVNINMTDLNIQSSSTIDTLIALDTPLIDNLTANASNISNLTVNSGAASMTVSGSNTLNTTVNNNLLSVFTGNFGVNDLVVSSTKTGSSTFDITADETYLFVNLGTINIDDTSAITTLNVDSSNLANLNAGTANITNLNILDTAFSLDLIGTIISDIVINGTLSSLDITSGLGTNVTIDNEGTFLLSVDTNTSDIVITSLGDVSLTSATLTSSTINTTSLDDVNLFLSKPALDFAINGDSRTFTITSTTLNNLSIGVGFNAGELELINTNLTSLDLSNGLVHNYLMSGNTGSLDLTGNDLASTTLNLPNLNSFTINSTQVAGWVDILGSDSTIDLNGNIARINIVENSLTAIDLTDITLSDFIVNSDALLSLDTLSSISRILEINTNNDNFNLTTDTGIVTFNSDVSHNLNLTTTSLTNLNLTTNVDSVTFDAATTEVSLFGENIKNLIGTVNTFNIVNSTTGIVSVNMDASSFLISESGYTDVIFDGVRTIASIIINGSTIESINTNNVIISTLDIIDSAQTLIIDSKTANINVNSEALSNTITINYYGSIPLELSTEAINDLIITTTLANSIDVSGDLANLTITGSLISSFTTSLLSVSNKLTMTDTLIDDLEYISVGLLASLNEIDMNSLDSLNTSSIVEKLRDSSITLVSDITEIHIFDDFYNSQFSDLTALEAVDNARYDGFRDTVILNAFNEIRTNEYFDHLTDIELNTAIDTQTYGDMQSYLDTYLSSISTTEAELITAEGEPFVQAIRDSIQATLDESVLTIVELDLTNSVDQSIIDDSNTYATTESGLIGFIIG